MKVCCTCKKEKPDSDFHKDATLPTGLYRRCKACRVKDGKDYYRRNRESILQATAKYRAAHREKNRENISVWRKNNPDRVKEYAWVRRGVALSVREYDEKLHKQHCRCAICKKHISSLSYVLVVDHDHVTGQVRGLLCQRCNSTLGMIEAKSPGLDSYLNYIEKWRGVNQTIQATQRVSLPAV